MSDACALFPKVLPPKGNMIMEVPAFKDPGEFHENNNEFYDEMTGNRPKVLYHGVCHEFAVGI